LRTEAEEVRGSEAILRLKNRSSRYGIASSHTTHALPSFPRNDDLFETSLRTEAMEVWWSEAIPRGRKQSSKYGIASPYSREPARQLAMTIKYKG